MDKIKKFLQKQPKATRKSLIKILELILLGDYENMDVKKLKGYKEVYRVRKGSIRIIFHKKKNDIFILSVEKRTHKTYR